MNQKGWGLQAMILWCVCLGILLIFASIMINNSLEELFPNETNNRNTNSQTTEKPSEPEENYDYNAYLEKMVTAAKKYITVEYNGEYENADYIKLSVKMLINNNYMSRLIDLKDNKIECIGYISIRYQNDELSYEPFLKCGDNYETDGFIERHAE